MMDGRKPQSEAELITIETLVVFWKNKSESIKTILKNIEHSREIGVRRILNMHEKIAANGLAVIERECDRARRIGVPEMLSMSGKRRENHTLATRMPLRLTRVIGKLERKTLKGVIHHLTSKESACHKATNARCAKKN